MNRLPLLALAAAAGIPLAGYAHSSMAGGHGARLVLRPAVTRLRGRTSVTVSGVHVDSLQVLPVGANDASGNAFRWQSLRMVDGAWVTTLPAPGRRGIYALRLRVSSRTPSFRSPGWFLRVLAPRTLSRPSFADPIGVVRWWVRTVPHGTLDAVKRWSLPRGDRRDTKLQHLFVIAYSPPGHPGPDEEEGTFITTFRDGYGARWQFLEAKLLP